MTTRVELEQNTLVIFLDETGQEELIDEKYPIFGYGGCAVMASDLEAIIYAPWRRIKAKHLGNLNSPFHSTDIGKPSKELEKDLRYFFETQRFSRFAAILKRDASVHTNFTQYQATYIATLGAIKNISKWYFHNTSLTLIVESSQRLNDLVENHFGKSTFAIDGIEIPVYKYFMDKNSIEPGLEIADYIIRAAGRNVLNRMQGKESRSDADYIFKNIDTKLQWYIELDAVDFTQKMNSY